MRDVCFDRSDVTIIAEIEDVNVLPAQPDVRYARRDAFGARYISIYNALHELRVSAELELPLATQLLYSELLRKVLIAVT